VPLVGHTDLVVLPEMFTTGFSMNAAPLAEPLSGPTVTWMQDQALRLQAVLTGSFICLENGAYLNRLIWVFPDGQFRYYDKRHRFSLAGEDKTYTAGVEKLIVEWKGWRVCPLICYDLRFPVWTRRTTKEDYDLLIFVANWPARRAHHWRALLDARAIENQSYVAGVNIAGNDGNGYAYNGDSCVIDFAGQIICRISGQEGAFTAELSLEELQEYRRQFPFSSDADVFELH
jgi:omega-amidase